MEGKKYSIILAFCFFAWVAVAQNEKAIYNAYVKGDMQSWKTVMDKMEIQEKKTNAHRLSLINYQYGYVAWCIAENRNVEAKAYMKKALNHIDYLEKEGFAPQEILAYKAAFIGFELNFYPLKAPFIGPVSIDYAKASVKGRDDNFLGYIQLGNIDFYRPMVFGGSKEAGIKHYLQALEIFDGQPELKKNNWNYLNLLATLVTAYKEIEDTKRAQFFCQQALTEEPDFKWAKDHLCPKRLNKTDE